MGMDKKTIEMLMVDAESKWQNAATAEEKVIYASAAHYLESKLDELETAPKYVAYMRTNGPDRLL